MSLTHQLFLQSLRELADVEQNAFDAHRMPLVARFLDHLWAAVPGYRARLDAHITHDSFDLTRWCDLPLLAIEDLNLLGAALTTRAPIPGNEVEEVRGPPGSPVRRRSQLARIAAECEREWIYERNGLDLAAPLAILRADQNAEPIEGSGWSITFAQSRWMAGDPNASPAEQLAWLDRTGAKLLRTDASIAEKLSDAFAGFGTGVSLDAIIVVDERLTPAVRAKIETAMDVPLLHVVEQPDIGVIAASDPDGGYLVPAATAVVEVVDAGGRPTYRGAVGELAVTPLYEYAVPRLRLATGIAASPGPEPGTLLGVRRLVWAGVSA